MVATLKAPPVSSPSRVVRGSGKQDGDFPDFDVPAGKYQKKATMESEASVQLGFHDFSDNSLLCNLQGEREKVAQVKIAHAGKPCLLFKFFARISQSNIMWIAARSVSFSPDTT